MATLSSKKESLMKRFILLLSILMGFSASSGFAADEVYEEAAVDLLGRMVSIRSIMGSGKTLEVAELLRGDFLDAGFSDSDINIIPMQDETYSLVVRYRGDGTGGKPILFMGHIDVVDALQSDWENDPFTMIEKDGYLLGRGVSDNKAGVALISTTFIRLKKEGFVPTRDMIISFTGDEEDEMKNVDLLVAEYRHLIDAEFALNTDGSGGQLDTDGEPLVFPIDAMEKTEVNYNITFRNEGGHSSMPQKDNAIYDIVTAIERIKAHRFPVRFNELNRDYFREVAKMRGGEIGEAMTHYADNPGDEPIDELLYDQPELAKLISTTCIPTTLNAGHGLSALPQSASVNMNCRIYPAVPIESVTSKLIELIDNDGLEIRILGNPKTGPEINMSQEMLAKFKKVVDVVYPGTPIIPQISAGATDGKATRMAGIPTYAASGVFGNLEGNFAHGLNERIIKKSFIRALDYWYEIIEEFAGQ